MVQREVGGSGGWIWTSIQVTWLGVSGPGPVFRDYRNTKGGRSDVKRSVAKSSSFWSTRAQITARRLRLKSGPLVHGEAQAIRTDGAWQRSQGIRQDASVLISRRLMVFQSLRPQTGDPGSRSLLGKPHALPIYRTQKLPVDTGREEKERKGAWIPPLCRARIFYVEMPPFRSGFDTTCILCTHDPKLAKASGDASLSLQNHMATKTEHVQSCSPASPGARADHREWTWRKASVRRNAVSFLS